MTPLKIVAVILICSVLLFQTQGASLYPPNSQLVNSQLVRRRRMTPFWRGISRPIGASCRDNSECSTRLCRSKHCALRTSQE